jgi:hypothetical protein
MSIQSNDVLLEQLSASSILQDSEKEFITTRLDKFDHLDKFKLKRYLAINDEKNIKETFRIIRDKILREEKEKEYLSQQSTAKKGASGMFDKIAPKQQSTEPLSFSLLSDTKFLGHVIPKPPEVRGQPFKILSDFSNLDQLSLLEPSHVTFSLDDNVKLLIKGFFDRVEDLFDDISTLEEKRGYFRLFMRSTLFNSYLNTGITALRHTEIQPRKIALNLIYQTDPIYLNSNQFEHASSISKLLKQLVEI